MVLGEAEAQIGEPQKPAAIILCEDLGDSGFIGVLGHVVVWWVIEVLDETIIARGVVAVELHPEELVGVPGGWEEVQAVYGGLAPLMLRELISRMLFLGHVSRTKYGNGWFVRDVLEGLRDEVVEVVAFGDLLLDVENGQLELLQQAVFILLLPLCEVEEVAGVGALTRLVNWKLLRPCRCRQVRRVWCGHDERLLCRDEVGLLNPWSVGVETMWTVVPSMLFLDGGER